MQTTLPGRNVVLLGIGHTNAHVLRMWKMRPIPDAQLTCVSDHSISTYSGMLPGVLAGHFPRERMEIDLVRLCAAAGARLIRDNVTDLDIAGRNVLFEDRPPLPFDVLSIGIGSIPSMERLENGRDQILTIKPMPTFLDRLEERLVRFRALKANRPLRIVVVGGGAGGVEIAFCVTPFVHRVLDGIPVEISLVHSAETLGSGRLAKTNALVQRRLAARGIGVRLGRFVRHVDGDRVTLSDGEQITADIVIWATGATAPPILSTLDLAIDARGFLRTRPTLQVDAGVPIFAVGDSGTIAESETPKAGVFAVRQGPILWRNIARQLEGRSLETYRPQSGFLKLLNTGDGQAIGEYRGFAFEGRWCRWLKDRIDGRFMDMYQDYSITPMGRFVSPSTPPAMRCTGCGGKVGGSILSKVLSKLEIPSTPGVLVGLDTPDDAAVVQPPDGRPLALTVDFFTAPLDDPYLVGRLSALHSASDAFAMNARPLWALALATIPLGEPQAQVQLLFDLLSGSLREFRRMGTRLVGGHTIEGPNLTVGFTMIAATKPGKLGVKTGFREGDHLILTKPIGTGILLAAQARAMCRARWFEPLVEAMLTSNQDARSLLDEFDLSGVTDITGFGLAGHLLEVLRASGLDAELHLDAIPLLPGVAEMLSKGIESTLAPANRDAEAAIDADTHHRATAAYAALFDPQTCGGLLIGVSERDLPIVRARLAESANVPWVVIGRLHAQREANPRIRILRAPE